MKNNNYRRPNGTARRLRRMEDKLDIVLSDLNHITSRLLIVERQQRENFTNANLNRLHASALRMKEITERESKILENMVIANKQEAESSLLPHQYSYK